MLQWIMSGRNTREQESYREITLQRRKRFCFIFR